MAEEEIEQMQISPVTIIQLEKILNYLVQNEEYLAKFNNFEIKFQGDYENNDEIFEIFTIYRKKRSDISE